MKGNKDEAIRCVQIAESANASGDKQRALKFIKIAQRLNKEISVDGLLAICETLDSKSSTSQDNKGKTGGQTSRESASSNGNVERTYTEEHEIRRNKDYYAILGVEKNSSVEEIRRAYKKLSLKVHPDKNQAPGSEEAFKKVCEARQYDQIGLVDEFEYNQQHNVRRRTRRHTNDMFHDEFDPDEIFRSFFGQAEMFRTARVYRTRGPTSQRREHVQEGGFNFMILLQLLPFLIIFLLAYLPFTEPDYALQKNYAYQIPKVTENYEKLEDTVEKEYKNILSRYCHVEFQKWNRNYPKPHCDKLQNLEVS
ncbi:hypothetical protein MKX01_029013 [Papaver californicum]|nr:hypothetical protein MKX01_029013 [Papaver californicum]